MQEVVSVGPEHYRYYDVEAFSSFKEIFGDDAETLEQLLGEYSALYTLEHAIDGLDRQVSIAFGPDDDIGLVFNLNPENAMDAVAADCGAIARAYRHAAITLTDYPINYARGHDNHLFATPDTNHVFLTAVDPHTEKKIILDPSFGRILDEETSGYKIKSENRYGSFNNFLAFDHALSTPYPDHPNVYMGMFPMGLNRLGQFGSAAFFVKERGLEFSYTTINLQGDGFTVSTALGGLISVVKNGLRLPAHVNDLQTEEAEVASFILNKGIKKLAEISDNRMDWDEATKVLNL